MYKWMFMFIFMCMNTCLYLCVYDYVFVFLCVYARMYLCMYVKHKQNKTRLLKDEYITTQTTNTHTHIYHKRTCTNTYIFVICQNVTYIICYLFTIVSKRKNTYLPPTSIDDSNIHTRLPSLSAARSEPSSHAFLTTLTRKGDEGSCT